MPCCVWWFTTQEVKQQQQQQQQKNTRNVSQSREESSEIQCLSVLNTRSLLLLNTAHTQVKIQSKWLKKRNNHRAGLPALLKRSLHLLLKKGCKGVFTEFWALSTIPMFRSTTQITQIQKGKEQCLNLFKEKKPFQTVAGKEEMKRERKKIRKLASNRNTVLGKNSENCGNHYRT